MSLWEALVLGVVQGATEFLPVSSTGHLVLAQDLLGLRIPGVVVEVAVHLATLISILLVYRNRVVRLVVGSVRGDREALDYLWLLVVATIPAAVIGVVFEEPIEAIFDHPAVAGVGFLATGFLLWSTRAALRRDPDGRPDLVTALLMGCVQAFAFIPGISRSGSTVVAGLWGGVAAREAAAFSFLMAIPAIAGAALLQLPELQSAGIGAMPLLVGSAAAAGTGVLAIQTFVRLLQRQTFHRFSYYLWPLGAGFLLYLLLT